MSKLGWTQVQRRADAMAAAHDAGVDPACINCGEPIRFQDGSAKYRHLRNGRYGPTRCQGRDTYADADLDRLAVDVEVALDGGQLHLDLE